MAKAKKAAKTISKGESLVSAVILDNVSPASKSLLRYVRSLENLLENDFGVATKQVKVKALEPTPA